MGVDVSEKVIAQFVATRKWSPEQVRLGSETTQPTRLLKDSTRGIASSQECPGVVLGTKNAIPAIRYADGLSAPNTKEPTLRTLANVVRLVDDVVTHAGVAREALIFVL